MIDFSESKLTRLIQGELSPNDFNIGSIKLWEDYTVIPLEEITEIGLFDTATNKYFDAVSDYTFKERLAMLTTHNAFIHLAGGLSCGIANQKITQIRIRNKYFQPFISITKNNIEKWQNKPDKVLYNDAVWRCDYAVDDIIFVYQNESMYFFFDPELLTLKEIRIGKVNETYYSI